MGSGLIGCKEVEDAVFDNNMFYVYADNMEKDKRVDTILSFSDNAGSYMETSINITNNYFELNYTTFSHPNILANNILFENNTYKHPDTIYIGSVNGFNLKGSNESNIIVRNNKLTSISLWGTGIVYANYIYKFSSEGSFLIYDNYLGSEIAGAVTLDSDSLFYNNTIVGGAQITITGDNVILSDSNVSIITVNGGNKNIT